MQRVAYVGALFVFIAATALTITGLFEPSWLTHEAGQGEKEGYGLSRHCLPGGLCTHWPKESECYGDKKFLCSFWRSADYAAVVALVLELATIVAHILVIIGGREKREDGWRLLAGLTFLCAIFQIAAVAIISWLYEQDANFKPDWYLGAGWIITTASWAMLFLLAPLLCIGGVLLRDEDGYEMLQDEEDDIMAVPRAEQLRSSV